MNVKLNTLRKILDAYQQVVILYSGGIDSTLLTFYANKILGKENVRVIICNSQLHKEHEIQAAVEVANYYRWNVHVEDIDELSHPSIRNNRSDSWYFSKRMMYQAAINLAKTSNFKIICDGMILDDLKDYRPGMKARDELSIRSPLIEAKFDKNDVREIAKYLSIPTWNQKPSCSLLSRFPYDAEISSESIIKVKKVENLLEKAGYHNPRARYYHSMVKIEISKKDIEVFLNNYRYWNKTIKDIGFSQVALDLEGYRSGKMNDDLNENK